MFAAMNQITRRRERATTAKITVRVDSLLARPLPTSTPRPGLVKGE
jgi:hypothetical protein